MTHSNFTAGARVTEVGKGKAGLTMQIGPTRYRATIDLPEPSERDFAAHFGKLARLTVSFDEAEGEMAEQLAGKTVEVARLLEVLAAAEAASGTSTGRIELSHSACVVTAADDRGIAEALGQWVYERGARDPSVGAEKEAYRKSVTRAGLLAADLRRTLRDIVASPKRAQATAASVLAELAQEEKMTAFLDACEDDAEKGEKP